MIVVLSLAVSAFAQLPVPVPKLPVGPTGPVGVPAAPPVPKVQPPKVPVQPPKAPAPTPKAPTPKAPTPSLPAPKAPTPKAPTPKAPTPKAPSPKLPDPKPAPKLPISLPTPQLPSSGSGSGSSSAPTKVNIPGVGTVQLPAPPGGGSSGGGSGGKAGGTIDSLLGGGGSLAGGSPTGGGGPGSPFSGGPGFGGGSGGYPVGGGPSGPAAGPGGTAPGTAPALGLGPAAAILLEAENALGLGLSAFGTGGVSADAVQAAIVSVNGCLSAISPLERSVLMLRYGLDGGSFRSPSEVGRALRLSTGAELRVERRALRNLRTAATTTNCGAVASASGLPVFFDPTTIVAAAANPFGVTPGADSALGRGPARVAAAGAPMWTGAGHGGIGWLLLAIAVLGGSLLAGGLFAHGYQRTAPQRGPAPELPSARRDAHGRRRPRPSPANRAAAHGRRRAGERRQSVRFRRQGQAPDDD